MRNKKAPEMEANTSFRNIEELSPGDVILCHCDPSQDIVARIIHEVTSSEYCHAAIYYGNSLAAESTAKNGLKKGKIEKIEVSDLVSRYGHVALLRQPDAWRGDIRVKELQLFIDKVVETESKYNCKGILAFKKRRRIMKKNLYENLAKFFDENPDPVPTLKHKYFCSEFVTDCFTAVGFIEPRAAVLYQSDICAPGDFGKDPTFGAFWGYVTKKPEYVVEESDYFYQEGTYDKIFGA
jgi:hypothetical protein